MSDGNSYWMNEYIENQNKMVLLIQRIEELEKNVKAWADGQRIGAKEIAELREKVKLSVLNEAIINGHTKELNELKDLRLVDQDRDKSIEDSQDIFEEVLRKLGYDYIKHMKEEHSYIIPLNIEKSLAKLDSQGKTDCVGICGFCEIKETCKNPKRLKQTEKKEINCDNCKTWALGCELDGSRRRDCSRQNYKFFREEKEVGFAKSLTEINEELELLKKDSGGELSDDLKVGVQVSRSSISSEKSTSSDSKPPEPKPICPECETDNGVYPLSNGLWHCGDCNFDIEDRLPGGTGVEPREDDCGEHEYTLSKTCVYCGHWESLSPLYDMVKREKIERIGELITLLNSYIDHHANDYEGHKLYEELQKLIGDVRD